MSRSDSEWDQRILCSDGNCIGIIGADGRCTECGLPYDGEAPSFVTGSGTDDGAVDDSPADPEKTNDVDSADDEPAAVSGSPGDTWEDRILCVDESCIGVVGSDGRCNECGKPYPG